MTDCPREGCDGFISTMKIGDKDIPWVACPMVEKDKVWFLDMNLTTADACPLMKEASKLIDE